MWRKIKRSCDNNMYHASYGAFVPYHTFYSTVLCRHGGVDKVCTLNGGQYSGGGLCADFCSNVAFTADVLSG